MSETKMVEIRVTGEQSGRQVYAASRVQPDAPAHVIGDIVQSTVEQFEREFPYATGLIVTRTEVGIREDGDADDE